MILRKVQRHPFAVRAFFRYSLVLTYALPAEILRPLLSPGLILDSLGDFGFVAIAMVQTESLRPAFLPRWLGQNFFLCGYRIFARFQNSRGRNLRGLRILRSDTDRQLMRFFGNAFTHYQYRLANVSVARSGAQLEIEATTPAAEADLHVIAQLDQVASSLPNESPFTDWHQARLFAGPLPFTFDYEPETHSIVLIEGVRENWRPRPVQVHVLRASFFEHPPFRDATPILASAFHVENIPYRWKRGVIERCKNDA